MFTVEYCFLPCCNSVFFHSLMPNSVVWSNLEPLVWFRVRHQLYCVTAEQRRLDECSRDYREGSAHTHTRTGFSALLLWVTGSSVQCQ